MKLKLLLLLIASSISNLHAAFTLTDITTPAKKACTDVACILAKYPSGVALTTGLAGCTLMSVQRQRKETLEREEKDWDMTFRSQLDAKLKDSAVYTKTQSKREFGRRKQLELEIEQEKKNLAAGKTTYENIIKEIQASKRQTDLKTIDLIDACVQQAEEHTQKRAADAPESDISDSEYNLLFTHSYLKHKQQFAVDKAKHTSWMNAGAFIALSSIAGYGIYKAFPQLKKWFSALIPSNLYT